MPIMSNVERDISRHVTQDDQDLHKKIYKGKQPGILQYVPGERANVNCYARWESLFAYVSPWRVFLEEPEELFKASVRIGIERPENKYDWLATREQSLYNLKRELREASEVSMKVAFHLNILDPQAHYVHLINEFGENRPESYDIQLGRLVMISQATRNDILDFANSNPWGRDGGFQKLANMIRKPVNAIGGEMYGGEPLISVYLPNR